MQQKISLSKLLINIWQHLESRRKLDFGVLLFVTIIAGFAEVVSIGAVLPFLAALTAPEQLFLSPLAQPIISHFEISRSQDLQLPLAILFAVVTIIAGAIRLYLVWANTRLSFSAGADLSISIYRRTLYQPYQTHVDRNSSDIINSISTKTNAVIFNVISPFLTLISSVLMLVIIVVALVSLDPIVTLGIFGGFGLMYFLIINITKYRLFLGSQRIARESTQVIKALQEGLGGIRDVLIDGTQETYCQIYQNADLPLRRAQGLNQFISYSPRYLMEVIGMLLITILAYVASRQVDGIGNAIPIIGTLVLGTQRLLPVMQQGYWSWANITGSQASLNDVVSLLNQPLPNDANQVNAEPMPFVKAIQIRDVSFRYSSSDPWVLKDFHLTIPKSSRFGFIGSTGSGKSTLLDIIMGLLQPTKGYLEIDGRAVSSQNQRAWQTHVAHVPQAIFLTDATIAENIAFGVPLDQIDHAKVRQSAEKAQLSETIQTWTQQYNTIVGERGVRLSGGQRQRIGIARALYKNADVIIFDEATSALDNETERAVMEAIESLGDSITILLIAHRLTTLKNCTHIVEIESGGIKRFGSYQQLIENELLNNP